MLEWINDVSDEVEYSCDYSDTPDGWDNEGGN